MKSLNAIYHVDLPKGTPEHHASVREEIEGVARRFGSSVLEFTPIGQSVICRIGSDRYADLQHFPPVLEKHGTLEYAGIEP